METKGKKKNRHPFRHDHSIPEVYPLMTAQTCSVCSACFEKLWLPSPLQVMLSSAEVRHGFCSRQ